MRPSRRRRARVSPALAAARPGVAPRRGAGRRSPPASSPMREGFARSIALEAAKPIARRARRGRPRRAHVPRSPPRRRGASAARAAARRRARRRGPLSAIVRRLPAGAGARASRRSTSRSTWSPTRSRPRWPPAARSCSSRRRRRRSPRCASASRRGRGRRSRTACSGRAVRTNELAAPLVARRPLRGPLVHRQPARGLGAQGAAPGASACCSSWAATPRVDRPRRRRRRRPPCGAPLVGGVRLQRPGLHLGAARLRAPRRLRRRSSSGFVAGVRALEAGDPSTRRRRSRPLIRPGEADAAARLDRRGARRRGPRARGGGAAGAAAPRWSSRPCSPAPPRGRPARRRARRRSGRSSWSSPTTDSTTRCAAVNAGRFGLPGGHVHARPAALVRAPSRRLEVGARAGQRGPDLARRRTCPTAA